MASEPDYPLTARFTSALLFAADIHRGQFRKGGRTPYLSHVLGVASLALDFGADEDEAIAAALHDTIEDAPDPPGADGVRRWIAFNFGPRVLEIVEGCTDADTNPKPAWRERKEKYVASIAGENASTVLVSAADKLHNARSVLTDFRSEGLRVFDRFNPAAGVDGTVGYYRGLVTAFSTRAAQLGDLRLPKLLAELDRTVTDLEREVGIPERGEPSGRSS